MKAPSRATLSPRERAVIVYPSAWREGAFSSVGKRAIKISD